MSAPAYADEQVAVYLGDCLDVLATLPDSSVHAVVTDPPYGLARMDLRTVVKAMSAWLEGDRSHVPDGAGFMGNRWDRFVPPPAVWDECYRVLKPGGHLLAFAGSRTTDLMTASVRLAGFEIRDTIAWVYAQGFPKSMDVSLAIDNMLGAERPTVGSFTRQETGDWSSLVTSGMYRPGEHPVASREAVTEQARRWSGWGTNLRPSLEPITVARKPPAGSVAANVLEHGTGALNVDATRTEMSAEDREKYARGSEAWVAMSERRGGQRSDGSVRKATEVYGEYGVTGPATANDAGRWPPNVVLDDQGAAAMDGWAGAGAGEDGPSRYFPVFRYGPKAGRDERPRVNGKVHPTVKPVDLIRWLVRLVTPPGGVVLDPFLGSGTTVEAALAEGFDVIGIERDPEYLDLILARLARPIQPVLDLGGMP